MFSLFKKQKPIINKYGKKYIKNENEIYKYECKCRFHMLSKNRHKMIQQNPDMWYCKTCIKTIIYKGEEIDK